MKASKLPEQPPNSSQGIKRRLLRAQHAQLKQSVQERERETGRERERDIHRYAVVVSVCVCVLVAKTKCG